jgi:hypothetical protein
MVTVITFISVMPLYRARTLRTDAAFLNMESLTGFTVADMAAYF